MSLALAALLPLAGAVAACADVIGLENIEQVDCVGDCKPDGATHERSDASPADDATMPGHSTKHDAGHATKHDAGHASSSHDTGPSRDAGEDAFEQDGGEDGGSISESSASSGSVTTSATSSGTHHSSTHSASSSHTSGASGTHSTSHSGASGSGKSGSSTSASSTSASSTSASGSSSTSSQPCMGQCAGTTPECDLNTGTCVACLPPTTGCDLGYVCTAVGGPYMCVAGCTNSTDCPAAGNGDAQTCCGTDPGACLDLLNDASNCGTCGHVCPTTNSTSVCTNGACEVTCTSTEFTNCDGTIATNGCNVDLYSNVDNCLSCGNACPTGNGAFTYCDGPSYGCEVQCEEYYEYNNCDGTAATNGCNVDLYTDVNNCGSCGHVCPNTNGASSYCSDGACDVTCTDAEFTNCDGTVATNGCNIDLYNDCGNCGSCGSDFCGCYYCSGGSPVYDCSRGQEIVRPHK